MIRSESDSDARLCFSRIRSFNSVKTSFPDGRVPSVYSVMRLCLVHINELLLMYVYASDLSSSLRVVSEKAFMNRCLSKEIA